MNFGRIQKLMAVCLAAYSFAFFSPLDEFFDLSPSRLFWLASFLVGWTYVCVVTFKENGFGQLVRDNLHRKVLVSTMLFISMPVFQFAFSHEIDWVLSHEWHALVFVGSVIPLLFLLHRRQVWVVLFSSLIGVATTSCYFIYASYFEGQVDPLWARPDVMIASRDSNFVTSAIAGIIPLTILAMTKLIRWYSISKITTNINIGKFLTLILMGLLLLFLSVTILSQSRTGSACSVLMVLLSWVAIGPRYNKFRLALGGAIVALLAVALIDGRLTQRIKNFDDKSAMLRIDSYHAAFETFKAKPLLGAGITKSAENYYPFSGYGNFESENPMIAPHNMFLQIASELGIVGLGIFILIAISVWKILRRPNWFSRHPLDAKLCLISVAGLLLCGMLMPIAYLDWIYWLIMVSVLLIRKSGPAVCRQR